MKQIFLIIAAIISIQMVWAGEANFQCVNEVTSYSDRDKMAAKDFSANVLWHDIELKSTTIGYGPAGDRADEITIVDGKIYLVHPSKTGDITVNNQPDQNKGVAMLQIASPEEWKEYKKLDEVLFMSSLNSTLNDISDEMKCGEDVLIPFKILGHAKKVIWSLDTQPEHLVKETIDQDVVIVGIYNRDQRKRLFLVSGYNLHAHVLIKEDNVSGHMRDIELLKGATLLIPEKS